MAYSGAAQENKKSGYSSPNFRDGKFHNLSPTPVSIEGVGMGKMIYDFTFNKDKNSKPKTKLPFIKKDISKIDFDVPVITWFGHSTYLIRFAGKTFLVDPVFSNTVSPVPVAGPRKFATTDEYSTDDLPGIDFLIISHDHYDHLDKSTIKTIKAKVKKVIVPLGVSEYFIKWGYNKDVIIELDWWQSQVLNDSDSITSAPARHFSGRGLTRNTTLWSSYALKIGNYKIFIGGDSGYDFHFKEIGERLGPFQMAILECGQYNKNWPFIHMMPEETALASLDLKAEVLFPVHWAKFSLALHGWTDPIEKLLQAADKNNVKVLTPMMGESFKITEERVSKFWWRNIK